MSGSTESPACTNVASPPSSRISTVLPQLPFLMRSSTDNTCGARPSQITSFGRWVSMRLASKTRGTSRTLNPRTRKDAIRRSASVEVSLTSSSDSSRGSLGAWSTGADSTVSRVYCRGRGSCYLLRGDAARARSTRRPSQAPSLGQCGADTMKNVRKPTMKASPAVSPKTGNIWTTSIARRRAGALAAREAGTRLWALWPRRWIT